MAVFDPDFEVDLSEWEEWDDDLENNEMFNRQIQVGLYNNTGFGSNLQQISNQQIIIQPTHKIITQHVQQFVTQPTQQIVTQPTQQIVAQPTQQIVAQPTRQIVTHPTQQIVAQPTQQIVTQPTQQILAQPTQQIVAQPTQQIVTQPTQYIVAQPTQQSVTLNAQQIVTQPAPAHQILTQPMQQILTQPAQQIIAQPIQQIVAQPTQQIVAQPTQQIVTLNTQQIVKQPAQQIITQHTQHILTQPKQQIVTQLIKQIVTQPTQQIVAQPTQQILTQPAQQIITQPTQQIPTQPTQQIVAQPTQLIVAQPTQLIVAQPTQQIVALNTQQIASHPTQQIATHPAQQIVTQPTQQIVAQPTQHIVTQPTQQILTQPTQQILTQLPQYILEESYQCQYDVYDASYDCLPHYWNLKQYQDSNIRNEINSTQRSILQSVDDKTYIAIATLFHDTMDLSSVGVGRDARSLIHQGVEICSIQRVENPELFQKYHNKKKEMIQFYEEHNFSHTDIASLKGSKGKVVTSFKLDDSVKCDLNETINEFYLFHGTKPEAVDKIINKGLDPLYAKATSMFGKGIYAAEMASKADQYTDNKLKRATQGSTLTIFLTRMLMGNTFLCDHTHKYVTLRGSRKFRRPPCVTCLEDHCDNDGHVFYDSVLADGRWMYREFVVYERFQAYPEYVITYKRIYDTYNYI